MKVFYLIVIFFIPTLLLAQIAEPKVLYPGVEQIKIKHFNGGKHLGWISYKTLDDKGRIIQEESYRNQELRGKRKLIYNDKNDIVFDIQFGNENAIESDTISYEYRYSGNGHIEFQKARYHQNYYSECNLLKSDSDTLSYSCTSYYYRPELDSIIANNTQYDILSDGWHILFLRSSTSDGRQVSHQFTYSDGLLRRKQVFRNVKQAFPTVYLGGMDTDDVSYDYNLNKAGRIKMAYIIIDGKRFRHYRMWYKTKQ